MSTLIVTLPISLPTATTPCSTVLTEDGQTVKQQTEAPLSLWADVAGGEIVAMVPATQLSWHRLDLPKGTLERSFFQEGGHSRLRSVIEGLIEDRLLDEPAQLHFAIDAVHARDLGLDKPRACKNAKPQQIKMDRVKVVVACDVAGQHA